MKPRYGKRSKEFCETMRKASVHRMKPVIQMDMNGKIIGEFESSMEAGRKVLGKKNQHISDCCNGKRKTCGGYKWKFKTA